MKKRTYYALERVFDCPFSDFEIRYFYSKKERDRYVETNEFAQAITYKEYIRFIDYGKL